MQLHILTGQQRAQLLLRPVDRGLQVLQLKGPGLRAVGQVGRVLGEHRLGPRLPQVPGQPVARRRRVALEIGLLENVQLEGRELRMDLDVQMDLADSQRARAWTIATRSISPPARSQFSRASPVGVRTTR